MLDAVTIKATTLPDVWFRAVHAILDHGQTFIVDQGSYAGQTRLEFDYFTGYIEKPYLRDVDGRPLVPELPEGSTLPPPVEKDYVAEQYWKYLMTPEKKEGEQYTYGERLTRMPLVDDNQSECRVVDATTAGALIIDSGHSYISPWRRYLNQIEFAIWTYRSKGPRNNQIVLQVGQPTDMLLEDPPCLRHIDTRIQDGKLHFHIYFRSWDLWNGLPANLAGISLLQEYMAAMIGVDQGEMVISSKGLHMYGYAVELAEARCLKIASKKEISI
jgi:thymidylate synthase